MRDRDDDMIQPLPMDDDEEERPARRTRTEGKYEERIYKVLLGIVWLMAVQVALTVISLIFLLVNSGSSKRPW